MADPRCVYNAFGLSPRQRRFLRNVSQGMRHKEAYLEAGYTGRARQTVREVLRDPRAQKYLIYLEERIMRKHDVTMEKVLKDLQRAMDLAEREGSPAAMVNAAMAQAKIVGLVVNKSETKQVKDMNLQEVKSALKDVFGDKADKLLKELGVANAEANAEQPPGWDEPMITETVQ